MLVLARRIGEMVAVGQDVAVVVVELGGGQVKLAFVAPDSVRIMRAEVASDPTPAVIEARSKMRRQNAPR